MFERTILLRPDIEQSTLSLAVFVLFPCMITNRLFVIIHGKRTNTARDSVLCSISGLRRIVLSNMHKSYRAIRKEDAQGDMELVPRYWIRQKLSSIVQVRKTACQNIRS